VGPHRRFARLDLELRDPARDLCRVSQREFGVHWDRVLFSARRRSKKAWYPLTSQSLDFTAAVITIDPNRGQFTTHLLVAAPTGADGARCGSTGAALSKTASY
jgi:4'-phosphopantetheinyl transferase EntD